MRFPTLNQNQRLLVAIIYIILLASIFHFLGGGITHIWDTSKDSSIWFYSGALLIILGSYVAQPFFTKPTDALANSATVIVALLSINNRQDFILYRFAILYALVILISSIVAIATRDQENETLRKIGRGFYLTATNFGNSKVIFSIVYLLSALTYFGFSEPPNVVALIMAITFWISLTLFDVVGFFVSLFKKLSQIPLIDTMEIGKAIACENPLLYKVEISLERSQKIHAERGNIIAIQVEDQFRVVGLVININQLLGKKWLSIFLLKDQDDNIIKVSTSHRLGLFDKNSILSSRNLAYKISSLDSLTAADKLQIENSVLYSNFDRFTGFVDQGSNINTIDFHLLKEAEIVEEGDILEASINGKRTLYQVIDGLTLEESLENRDVYGYTRGKARKLGDYNEDLKELNVVKWMPDIYSTLYLYKSNGITEAALKVVANESIGRLPGTTYQIPVNDINALITHNTAILGILGIGKSRLTFELIQKALNGIESLKVICIDITNEYRQGEKLPSYIPVESIQIDEPDAFNEINAKYEYIETIGHDKFAKQIPDKSGNLEDYRLAIKADIINFLFEAEEIPDEYVVSQNKRVRIYNPDFHKVSKGEKMGIHVLTPALSVTEKARIISEETLKILMKFPPVTDSSLAKVLLVFEEAHSLVPEWNSISNEGDKTAVNGTAKVILQGRKYGLGSFVITQRTANISKSILNQCNTVFALRVFDDTGKQFLENYIGSDYANTLPTLDERHAIAVGKALKLKQPVIIQLNHMKYIMTSPPAPDQKDLEIEEEADI